MTEKRIPSDEDDTGPGWPPGVGPSGAFELMKVTAVNGKSLTVSRGEFSTAAKSWVTASPVVYQSHTGPGDPMGWNNRTVTRQVGHVMAAIALADDDRSLEAMTALRELGVGIAFDDFGTGYASLSSLQRYPLTMLKIDRGFIQQIRSRPNDAAITRALIGLSRDMGLDTVAEGIETREQEEALLALGCPYGQGYLFGRPMPFSAAVGVIEQNAASTPPKADCI